jgi:phosphatidylglycerol:prolipoprotein diacylglycerol transferase
MAIPFPDIDPVAISIGPLSVKWYGLAYVAGFVGGWMLMRRLVASERLWVAGQRRPTVDQLDDLLMWVVGGVIFGGRLGFVLFYDLDRYIRSPQEIFAIWQGGMSFHGGLIGAVLGMLLFARRNALPALTVFDLAGVSVPIGLLFGRIANFINGELWGRAAPDIPWAVIFPDGGPVGRHPSQLYEAATEGLLLLVVMLIAANAKGFRRPGWLAGLFGIGYALARIVCEFFREPDPQLGFLFGRGVEALQGGITMGMLLSLPMLLIGILLMLRARAVRPV